MTRTAEPTQLQLDVDGVESSRRREDLSSLAAELERRVAAGEITPLDAFVTYRDEAGGNYDQGVAPLPF